MSRADAGDLWTELPDLLLEREAQRSRIRRGVAGDALMGLRIDDAEVERLLGESSGGPADPAAEATLDAHYEPLVDAARERFRAALDHHTPLAVLARNARLSAEEAEVLGLLCAVELEPRRQRLLGHLQDDVTLRHITVHGLARCFRPPHVGPRAIAPGGSFDRAALVERSSDRPFATTTVRLHEAVSWWLIGAPLDTAAELPVAEVVAAAARPDGPDVLMVTGPDRVRRLELAASRTPTGRLLATRAPETPEGWRALVRHATLDDCGILLEVDGALGETARAWIERADHRAWVVSSRVELPLEAMPRRQWREERADDDTITPREWEEAFPDESDEGRRLSPEQLRLAASASRALEADAQRAIRRLAGGHLDRLARRIRPRRNWDDLVLSPDRLAQLRELVDRYRNRSVVHGAWGFPDYPSAGLTALFSGPSGTGKTLTAEIVAADLGVDLFKVDVASVVSKYIGETEKNLEEIFTAAATTNLVLLFDEADAMFGKRSEVHDARDRYANLEVSYLLQRLESYDGLVVLTTNFRKNIDDAFLRRIHVAVEFPVPDAEHRRLIWERSLKSSAPVDDGLDLDFVAERFEISGGSIHNAALSAAFLAAGGGSPISMETVILALKREYQKLGRLVTEHDFGPYFHLVRDAAPDQ